MARVLFHIDLNAFFASAEELRHPEYKDRPLAVGSLSSRGVLSTCNYKAREMGLHSAMPVAQAKSICPDLVLLPVDHDYYKKLSSQFFAYLRTYSGLLEVLSIDECFLDVTETIRQFERPLDLAVSIQQGVLARLGLKCSIGVAPTRFLAKMASDMRKPMGISVLRKSEIEQKLYPLDVSACIGIGVKTVPKLNERGIFTIGDLADPEKESDARAVLQNSWYDIKQKIHGQSSDQLIFSSTRKSISHSRTFPTDIYTLEEVLEQASRLARELCASMNRHGKKGKQLSVVLRDISFHNEVHSVPLPMMTNSYPVIYEAARNLFTRYFEPVGYRHLGISIGSLQDEDAIIEQPTLFDDIPKTSNDIINVLNKQLGANALGKASDLLKKKEAQAKEAAADKSDASAESREGTC